MSNYATKSDLKNATVVDTSQFAKKYDLYNLKSEIDKLDIGKLSELDADQLKSILTDLSKLSDVVKNDVVKKKGYNGKIKNIEDKIPSITNLATNSDLNTKINEVKNEILNITDLATTTGLTAVENRIPNVSGLVKKAYYDAEIKDIKDKYFTTSDYNKFTNNILDAKITAKKLVNESGLNVKIKTLATKEEMKKLATKAKLKAERDEIIKLQTYDLSLFIGESYFVNDGAQLFIILQPLYSTLKRLGDTEKLYHGNLKVSPPKNLLLLPLLIIVFVHQLNGTEIQIFV